MPMPLTEQRLQEIAEWGEGLLQRGVDGRPMDAASRAIQQGLDEQKVSEGYVRDMRREVESEWKEGVSALPVPERPSLKAAKSRFVRKRGGGEAAWCDGSARAFLH
jgi:hypothetical protein